MNRRRAIVALVLACVVAGSCSDVSRGTETADGATTETSSGATTASTEATPDDRTDGEADAGMEAGAGAVTLHDPYVGSFGNGGYDIAAYDLAITWDPAAERLDGVATITATTTEPLSRFNLELTGLDVQRVDVDGEEATFTHDDPELTITPPTELTDGAEFTTTITYSGTPIENDFVAGFETAPSGWHTRDDYTYVAGEPLAASTYHPANDHPSDKASFTYRLTVPNDLRAAASGTLQAQEDNGDGTTTWTYRQPAPQTTYLTTILIGDFETLDGGTSDSGVPVRNVIDADLVEGVGTTFDV